MSLDRINILFENLERDLADLRARHRRIMKEANKGFYAIALEHYPELKPHLKSIKEEFNTDLKNELQGIYETVENMLAALTSGTKSPNNYPKFTAASFGEGKRKLLAEACYLKFLEVFYTVFPEILDFEPEQIEWINLTTKVSINELIEGFYYVTGGLREDELYDEDDWMEDE